MNNNSFNINHYDDKPIINELGFREYDARWIYPKQINLSGIKKIGYGLGQLMIEENIKKEIVIGHDYRSYSEEVKNALISGLLSYGITVFDIGLTISPGAYFAQYDLNCKSVAMVTASHNENGWTGFKMGVNRPLTFGPDLMNKLKEICLNDLNPKKNHGEYKFIEGMNAKYINDITNKNNIKRKLKAVVACGNGTSSIFSPEILEKIGIEVIKIHCDLDYSFPNYNPNPEDLKMLKNLSEEVIRNNADIGFAFDGDGDRVGLITNAGDMIFPDKQMMLFSEDILNNKKGSIVFDVKCSNHLINLISKNGGTPIMAPTGHFHIKKAIKKNSALLGGEMSGHIFFNDKWYGFDDGPYAAARAAEILAKSNKSISEIFSDFPESFSTPELNITVTDENKFEIIDRFMANSNIDGDKILIDGLRVNFNDGWGLLRASNTTPKLVLRFEGDTEDNLNQIKNLFENNFLKIFPDIKLDYH